MISKANLSFPRIFSPMFALPILVIFFLLNSVYAQEYAVTFRVDMTSAEDFDPDADTVYLTGSMFGWAMPGDDPANQTMSRVGDSMIWAKTLDLDPGEYVYKYFLNAGWGGGEWDGGDDRMLDVSDEMVVNNVWGIMGEAYTVTFDVVDENSQPVEDAVVTFDGQTHPEGEYQIPFVLPGTYSWSVSAEDFITQTGEVTVTDGDVTVEVTLETGETPVFSVTFNVDMSPAEDFDPDADVVYLTGSMLGWVEPGTDPDNQTMARVDDSMIWAKTLELEPGGYAYKYFLNAGWDGGEWEGGDDRTIQVAGDMTVDNLWGVLDDTYVVTFQVSDDEGQTIDHAVITFDGQTYPEGEYVIPNIFPGTYPWSVSAEGFITESGEASVVDQDVTLEITLETEEEPTEPEIVFANLQWPGEATIELDESLDVFAQVEVSLAEIDENDGVEGLQVWIGYHNENTHPEEWTHWIQAEYNGLGGYSGRPEYLATLGSDIDETGIYYYASRFQLNEEDYVYGGFNAENDGGFWNGTTNVSGVLTVVEFIETFSVTFNLDMSPAAEFNPGTDTVFVTGSMFGWAEPGDDPGNQIMTRVDNSMTWTNTLEMEAGGYAYKFFLNAGWEGGEWEGGDDRILELTGETTINNVWGIPGVTYTVSFEVTDTEGQPVEDAVVTFDGQSHPAGEYVFNYVFPGTYSWSVAAEGFFTQSGEVTVADQDVTIEVVMEDGEDPVFPVTFTVTDQTETYQAIELKGDMTQWETVPMNEGPDHTWTLTLELSPGTYEWGMIENDGTEYGEWLLPEGENLVFSLDEEGNISGEVSYTIVITNVPLPQDVFRVYPNPVKDVLFVDLPAEATIRLLDMNGRIIRDFTAGKEKIAIDFSSLEPGVFLLQISKGSKRFTMKIIKP